jgi:hypothetical protein
MRAIRPVMIGPIKITPGAPPILELITIGMMMVGININNPTNIDRRAS